MKLQTTITQTKELDILLPLFYKLDEYGTTYIAVLNEQTYIRLFINRKGDHVSITNCVPDKNHTEEILKAMNNWETIKQEEFLSAYDDALSAISLRPKLNESFVDALETIGLKTKETINRFAVKSNVNKNDSPVPDRVTVVSEIPQINP